MGGGRGEGGVGAVEVVGGGEVGGGSGGVCGRVLDGGAGGGAGGGRGGRWAAEALDVGDRLGGAKGVGAVEGAAVLLGVGEVEAFDWTAGDVLEIEGWRR